MTYTPTATQVAVKAIQTELSAESFELDDQIEGIIVAALAGENVLAYGPPGVNKSGTAHGVQRRIVDSKYGWWLMHPQLDITQLEGMMDLGHFKATSERINKIDGANHTIYNTNVLFLDEMDKAPAAIKTPLLTAINEHMGNWGLGWKPLDILFAMGAANRELGVEDEAISDRFLVKLVYEQMKSADNVLAMLDLADGQGAPAVPTTVHIDEMFHAVRVEVPAVVLPREVKLALVSLRAELIAEGFSPSNRRIFKCARLLRAKAWLEGRDTVELDDIFILRHALWETMETKAKVERIVLGHTGPTTRTAIRLMGAVNESRAKIDEAIVNDESSDDVAALGGRLMGDIRELRGQLTAARTQAGGQSDRLDEVELAINELHVSVFTHCMNNDEATARQIVKAQGGTRQAVTV